ncbi:hypothetical protein JW906_07210 [bacterium]|nr:hypothetical protein [bacterium]
MKKIIAIKSAERDILHSLKKNEWIPDFNRVIKKRYERYAKSTLNKNKRIKMMQAD